MTGNIEKPITFTIALLIALAGPAAVAQQNRAPSQEVIRAESKPAGPGPAGRFTGNVSVRPIVDPQSPGRTSLGEVAFPAGARSNWHTHPAGQILVVTEGCGWTQEEGGPVTRICKGDTVYAPAGIKHWHGATATTAMTHLAITESVNGGNVDWMEPVSDAQYRASQ